MDNKRILKLAIAVISLVICIVQIQQTYAKYLESKEGQKDFMVAGWKILINDQDVTEGAELSSLINPVYENNNHVANGVIAPGSEGYFDLEIDATNTEVSFEYSVSVGPSVQTNVADLIISGYKIDDGSIISVNDGEAGITNRINYNASDKVVNLRVYFKWLEGTGETMNNVADTSASVGGGTGKLLVTANFTQVLN